MTMTALAIARSAAGRSSKRVFESSTHSTARALSVKCVVSKPSAEVTLLDQLLTDAKKRGISEEERVQLIYALPGMYPVVSSDQYLREKREETAREDA